ncbi:3-methyl-2-oxobutanoate hydroxymethyltransferase [Kribbella sp. NPDC056345]|uniref:3-methyl-2-oxobutanoate hydroxymethyltransferase n=1 Tax=Kribbella sp. NPDC056345 TaxID=3345789 RepID=UPI0035D532AF
MVDNFMSAGTQDDDELPSPYGTGPSNRTTEEHRRSDYDSDPWRDRPNGLGLDPSPSLPNAPRQFERGPVPQQPYVPKPPYLPGPPPAQPPQQQRYPEPPAQAPAPQQPPRSPYGEPQRPEYYGEREQQARSEEQPYGQPAYPQESPFRPQQPPAPNRPSPFAPGNGNNGVPPNRQAPPPQQQPQPPQQASQQPPRPPAAPQGSNGLTQQAPPASNGSTNWSSPAPQQNGVPPTTGALPLQPPAPSQSPSQSQPQSPSPSPSNGLSPLQPPPGRQPEQQPPVQQSPAPLQPPTPPRAPAQPAPATPAPAPSQPQSTEQKAASTPSYLSDPSAEYESNAPVSEPRSRIGARRRADVQQDAPSQVPAEHVATHRARRAQAAATATAGTPEVANSSAPSENVSSDTGALSTGGDAGATSGDAPRRPPRRYRVHHLRDMKNRGEKWAMLTAYDQYTAEIFDQAGIPVLLVGDSAANNVFGYDTTLRVTVDELIPLARAVANAAGRALVVADLPFGSYQASPEQAFHTAVRFMKEAGVHAVKLEGGRTVVPMVEKLTQSGIPVMAHIGFTPQSEHSIGGYRVQGRGDQAAGLIDDAVALAEAGAFSVVLEMVPGDVSAEITKRIPIPTIGIGAGRDTDAQVLVWQDMAGLRSGPMPRFVKQYADLRGILTGAATTYAADVANGTFPTDDHTF